MTLLMRDNENRALGRRERLVSQVRNLDESQVEVAPAFLGVDTDTIKTIRSLIEKHPEKDDMEIAEIYINRKD